MPCHAQAGCNLFNTTIVNFQKLYNTSLANFTFIGYEGLDDMWVAACTD